MPRVLPLLPSCCLSIVAIAQEQPTNLHPFLAAQVRAAAPDQRLPVYFVLRERLDYDHWFPRVWSMPLAQRRATVIRELQEHATRTQAGLLDYLLAEERAGNAKITFRNWLGNFVCVEATPLVVLTGAAVDGVESVWANVDPPAEEVQDADPDRCTDTLPATVAPPTYGPPTPSWLLPPGNGPLAVKADRVWNFGIRGQGVVIANVDGGLTAHNDIDGRRWTNPGEIAGNGLDDDNNTLIDDVHGWSFLVNSANFDDGGGHGTSTAGCLVADGTCSGVIYGMAPQARVMTCQISGEASQWNSIQYALAEGADVQTSSYSYKAYNNPPPNYKMHRDLGVTSLAAGLIRTNSTSNDGARCASTTNAARKPFNISAPGCVPAPYLDPNQTLRGQLGGVIGVAAWLFGSDALASYSPCGPFAWNLPDLQVNVPGYPVANWDPTNHNDYPWQANTRLGLLKPDVSAPTGTTTAAAGPCGTTTFSGTSNATPCANGVIALWKSANPSLTPEDVGMIVHQTASDRGATPGKENNWGAGVIDAEAGLYRALCVHRVDHQPAWTVNHSIASGPLHLAVDGVPNSLAAMLVGVARSTTVIGPVTVGVGTAFSTIVVGLTDAQGDLTTSVPVIPALIGQTYFTQGFVQDLSITNRILSGNVVGITFVP